ncbi:MAG: hypothetical protein JXA91_00965, partial [Candidatus Thermoplasmatota archaeon]|nr:hypothetical protein [Candidatus Thermoplasmatota archaeon]
MKILIILFLLIIPIICFAQNEYQTQELNHRIITTSFVIQNWKIDGVDERIAEGTFPIDIIYPIHDNITVQFSHSPALSRFGETTLNGLSDTWLRSSYTFLDEKCAVSCGLGLPTGKTELTTEESKLDSLLSQNVFRFRLPVFGQGITANTGIAGAFPLSSKFAVGGGLNYVYRGKYKYRKDVSSTLDIGDQFGCTVGLDYYFSSKIRTNLDVIYTYFLNDK